MSTYIAAAVITFVFTALLTIAGVGAAFILIPIYIALGIDVRVAMAVALLLNSIAMAIASQRFVRKRLVLFGVAMPILVVASALSPLGAYTSRFVSRDVLLWLFVGFLVFAGSMMLFYQPRRREIRASLGKQLGYGAGVGAFAGYLGGLLGVGGGNFIVPVLVWLGIDPKNASATTAFIVIFSSFSGFLGHATLGHMDWHLLALTAVGSAAGSLVGAWLMTDRLKSPQVKKIIGVILYMIAARMMWKLIAGG